MKWQHRWDSNARFNSGGAGVGRLGELQMCEVAVVGRWLVGRQRWYDGAEGRRQYGDGGVVKIAMGRRQVCGNVEFL